ncbi:hypothetical protein ISN45_Aa07g028760 [Arabidopsis thaliana x Arabidopsis arenosa]|uniref:Transmembrane protein n=1 Tax=Arabidopsis thaliana x Arabidopsis arenosa TaxID=1240361 RepID=A0A8T1Y726_9BRAS|nr:hypothetical protein ISN45_Aa07g028760 [Arabidopsis thaliana x Arabidopsis arenosa]
MQKFIINLVVFLFLNDVSFYSFGHSSVDGVVAVFLKDQGLVRDENLGLGFWWEDESLAKSENLEELWKPIDSMSKILRDLKELRLDSGNNYQRDHEDDVKNNYVKIENLVSHETLNLQSSSETFGILDDCLKTETEMVVFDAQFLEISESTDKTTPKGKGG